MQLLSSVFGSNLLYIDPAATSMLLTSITAIVVAAGAGIFIAWRAIRKKVNKALHIDENAKKEVEDELVISDDLKEDGAPEVAIEQTAEEQAVEETAATATEEKAVEETEEKAVEEKPVKKTRKKSEKSGNQQ